MNHPFGKILPLQYELGTHRREGVFEPCMLKQRSDELELPSSLRLPGTTTREKKNDDNRNVRFRRKITARVVLSRHHYTPREMAACFYDDDESKGMAADAIRSIRALTSRGGNDGGSSRPNQDAGDDRCLPCFRGIEAMLSPAAMAERRRSKEDAIDAVLDEQDRQQQNTQSGDVVDREEALRRASIRATWATARRALKLAAEDEAFVRREMRRGRASERKTVASNDDNELLLGVLERASRICEQGARGSEGRENQGAVMTARRSRARISRLLASKSA